MYSALVLAGVILALAGAVIACVGIADSGAIEYSGLGTTLRTCSTGLVIMVVGAGMSVAAATKKPRDVQLFAAGIPPPSRSKVDVLVTWLRPAAVRIAAVAAPLVLLGIALGVHR